LKVDKRAGLIVMAAILGAAISVLLTCHSGPTDWTAFNKNTIEQNLAGIDSAGSIYQAQFAAGNIDAAAQQACAFLLTQPGVDSAAIAPDSTVWAYFSSGLLAGLGDDMEGADTTGVKSAPSPRVRAQVDSGGELSGSALYILPNYVDLPYSKQAADDIQNILQTNLGWDDNVVYLGDQVTIDLVKDQISEAAGLLYWAGHGVLVGRKDPVCALVLGNEYDKEVLAIQAVSQAGYYDPGPNKPRLAGVFYNRRNGKYHIVILPAFIRTYGNFDVADNQPDFNMGRTIVYLSCCFGAWDDTYDQSLVKAFLSRGADLVCGWDWAVNDGFAMEKDKAFFQAMSDTFLPNEALQQMGNLHCPQLYRKMGATFEMVGDPLVMLEAVLQCEVEGTIYRAYSGWPTVSSDAGGTGVTGDLCAKSSSATPVGMIIIAFPGNSPGTFDCATEDNASIYYLDNASATAYYVMKGWQGVSGTINIVNLRKNIITGTFTGVLGHWGEDQDPTKEPPQSVVHIDNGVLKYTGKFMQGSK
jgi:hypothetical protein